MDGVIEGGVTTEDPAMTGDGQEAEVAIDEAGGVAAVQIGVDMASAEGDQTAVVEVVDGDVVPASISGLVGSSSDPDADSAQDEAIEADANLYQDIDGFSAMATPLLTFFEAMDVMKQGAVVTRVDWVRETPEGQVARVLAFAPGGCPMDIRKPGSTHWRGIPLTLFHAVEGGAVSAPGFICNGHGSDRSLHGIDLLAEDWVVVEGMDSPVLPLPTAV